MDVWPAVFEAVPKCLVYLAAIVAVGAPASRRLLLARVAATLPSDVHARIESGLGRVAAGAATALVAALLFRAWGHTAAAFGPAEAFAWPSLSLIAFESEWGRMWQFQFAAAMALAVVTRGIGSAPSLAWPAAGVIAAAVCYSLPLLGHAAGEPARVLLHGSHVLAAGLWVGTLAATAIVVPQNQRATMLRAFAPVAATAVAFIALTGVIAVWLYVGSITALAATWYGRLVVVKVIFVFAVGGFGFINFRQLHWADARGGQSAAAALRGAPVLIELLLASFVVIVTAVLTELEHP